MEIRRLSKLVAGAGLALSLCAFAPLASAQDNSTNNGTYNQHETGIGGGSIRLRSVDRDELPSIVARVIAAEPSSPTWTPPELAHTAVPLG